MVNQCMVYYNLSPAEEAPAQPARRTEERKVTPPPELISQIVEASNEDDEQTGRQDLVEELKMDHEQREEADHTRIHRNVIR